MNNFCKKIVISFLWLFLAGCATIIYIEQNNSSWKRGYFEAELPINWIKYTSPFHELFLSKDGFLLQSISLSKTKTNKELPATKRKIIEGMLLQEISELVIDEMNLSQKYKNLKIISNIPTELGDIDAFKIEYSFNNDRLVKYQVIMYGFLYKRRYFEVEYLAIKQHYWDKSLKDFEKFVESFRLREN